MQYLSEATTATFQREVIERSATTVVLVDFWAAWCAPCRVLAPQLEAAVQARGGDVWLVKVDTDANRPLAERFKIRGIPAVKAFVDGKLAGEFVGAQDRAAIDAFIERVCPSAEQRALSRAEALLERGEAAELEGVPSLLEPVRQSPQLKDRALLLTARAQVALQQYDAAQATLTQIPAESLEHEAAGRLGLRVELLVGAQGADETARRGQLGQHPDDHEARWSLAGLLYARGAHREALEALLELLQRDRGFRADGARRAMLAIFDDLGADHELVREFRRQLQIYT